MCSHIRFTSIIKLLDQKGKYTISLLLFVWSRVFMCIVYIMCVCVRVFEPLPQTDHAHTQRNKEKWGIGRELEQERERGSEDKTIERGKDSGGDQWAFQEYHIYNNNISMWNRLRQTRPFIHYHLSATIEHWYWSIFYRQRGTRSKFEL